MKKEKIKALPFVTEFIAYFECRARRVLGVKKVEYRSISIDVYSRSGHIWVWFFKKPEGDILGRVQFTSDGRVYEKVDNRLNEEGEK